MGVALWVIVVAVPVVVLFGLLAGYVHFVPNPIDDPEQALQHRRRRLGWIGFVLLLLAIGVVTYLNLTRHAEEDAGEPAAPPPALAPLDENRTPAAAPDLAEGA